MICAGQLRGSRRSCQIADVTTPRQADQVNTAETTGAGTRAADDEADTAPETEDPTLDRLPHLVRMDVVATALSVTERHMRRLVAERRIPYIKVGYFIRFDPDDIAEWIAARRVEADVGRASARRTRRAHEQRG